MHALGSYILRGWPQAVISTTIFTLFSVMLFPAAYLLSGAPVALVTLIKGSRCGLNLMLGTALIFTLFILAVKWPVYLGVAYLIFIWIPIWLCAVILRLSRQQGMLVTAAGLMGMAILATLYIILNDIGAWWQDVLSDLIEASFSAGQQAEYRDKLLPMANYITGFFVAGFIMNLVATVMFSRWWQSLLFNPGGFAKEFQALRLPLMLLAVTILSFILYLLTSGPWSGFARDMLTVLVFMFLFQGLVLAHRTVSVRQLPHICLVIMYGLLFLVPGSALFMACLGMMDSWHANCKTHRMMHH